MRFDEKLIHLRKKNMLSQEGLAEKLNVTRQTVSKWELGQTKPDMDKLVDIPTYDSNGNETFIRVPMWKTFDHIYNGLDWGWSWLSSSIKQCEHMLKWCL